MHRNAAGLAPGLTCLHLLRCTVLHGGGRGVVVVGAQYHHQLSVVRQSSFILVPPSPLPHPQLRPSPLHYPSPGLSWEKLTSRKFSIDNNKKRSSRFWSDPIWDFAWFNNRLKENFSIWTWLLYSVFAICLRLIWSSVHFWNLDNTVTHLCSVQLRASPSLSSDY